MTITTLTDCPRQPPLTFRAAVTRHLLPASCFHVQQGPYLAVAWGVHNGTRLLIPGVSLADASDKTVTLIRASLP